MWNDLRFALRTLRRAPLHAVAAVITLGLGIAANTAVFSLLDHMVLRSSPSAVRHVSSDFSVSGCRFSALARNVTAVERPFVKPSH